MNTFEIGGYAWTVVGAGWQTKLLSGRVVAVGPKVVAIEDSNRCKQILDRPYDIEKVKAEAERLGLKVVEP